MMIRFCFVSATSLMLLISTGLMTRACPFCSVQGTTFSGEVSTADLIVVGTITNAKHDPSDFSKGTSELNIESVIKPHPWLAGRTSFTIPRFIPLDADGKPVKMLIFCELHTPALFSAGASLIGTTLLANPDVAILDAYRGEQLSPTSELAKYLKGAFEVREKSIPERLAYFFDYLDDSELQISTDALNEYASADYKDVRPVAEKLSAQKILGWIKNPGTPQSRLGLYGLLLGHCGTKADAAELRVLLDTKEQSFAGGLDGLLAAYVMLDAAPGWEYVMKLLDNNDTDQSIRYAVLKVFRFFWDYRSDIIPKHQVLTGMKRILAMPEMADLAIDDLRKWNQWHLTDSILALLDSKDHMREAMNRRAILKFAIAAPATFAKAKAYVEQIRKEDPDRVKYVEQALEDEVTPLPPLTKTNNN